jgi:hypothetical protein
MKRRKWRLILKFIIFTICILAAIVIPTAIFAIIAQPTTTPSLSNLFANRNLLVEGDMLIYGTYNIPYTSLPTTYSSETFSFRLLSLNGTTEYASNKPFVYFDNGYNVGVFSLYLTNNTTWGMECTLRISENPAMFDAPVYNDTTFYASYYSTETTQDANKSQLAEKIIAIANYVQPFYPTYTLTQSISGSYVLSSPTGETYFCGAIPLLQYMAPTLFLLQSYSADVSTANWTTDLFDTYEERFNGLWVGNATNATATQFNITPMMLTSMILILPLCVGAIIVSSRKYQRAEPGYVFCSIILILGAVMGWLPAALFASINQIMGIYIAYILFYARG